MEEDHVEEDMRRMMMVMIIGRRVMSFPIGFNSCMIYKKWDVIY